MIMNTKEAAHRLRMATIGLTGYEHAHVNVDALRIVLDALDCYRNVEKIAQPECKHCNDTGSLSKSIEGQFDCHHCGRADENVRVLKWYADTHLDSGTDADVLNVYYHGVAAGADLQRERIAELEREVAANREKIATGSAWIACVDRLPPVDELVLVFVPETQHSPSDIRMDCIDPNDDDHASWYHHNESYEHFCVVAKPPGSIGPSEKAPYTHWMPLPAAPSPADNGGGKP